MVSGIVEHCECSYFPTLLPTYLNESTMLCRRPRPTFQIPLAPRKPTLTLLYGRGAGTQTPMALGQDGGGSRRAAEPLIAEMGWPLQGMREVFLNTGVLVWVYLCYPNLVASQYRSPSNVLVKLVLIDADLITTLKEQDLRSELSVVFIKVSFTCYKIHPFCNSSMNFDKYIQSCKYHHSQDIKQLHTANHQMHLCSQSPTPPIHGIYFPNL